MGPPHPHSTRHTSTRLSCSSSNASHRTPRGKEHQFIYTNGSKLHAYDRDKAPYPSSFDRDVLELQCLDNAMVVASKGFSSFIDFKDKPPKRCLDIGTGLGLWVLSSARTWPESTFVGLDMVNIQPPLQVLESEMADRVEWVHTNILRNKLPFDDDEFDHVHMQCVALGIPENKWHDVFEEIRRVMKPGATIELLEEDAIFPILPRWYTNPLRAHARGPSTIYPGAVQQPSTYPSSFDTSELAHEHELLETLYHDVWSNRFINPTPSSCIPGYFGAFFDRVLAPPVLNFFTPPLAPFAPLPGVINGGGSTHTLLRPSSSNGSSDFSRESVSSLLTPLNTENMPDPSLTHSPTSTQPTSAGSVKSSLSPTPSLTSLHQEQRTNATTPNTEHSNGSTTNGRSPPVRRDSGAASVQSTTDSHESTGSTGAKVGRRPSVLLSSAAESTSLGGAHAVSLIPTDSLEDQEEQSRFMHLYRAVTFVLSTKEAMWEELAARVAARDSELRQFGWGEEDYTPHASRARFETAVDQYQSDMRGRISLWHSLVKNGWELPPRDPLGKTEIVEEMRLREDILASHRLAVEDTNEPDVPCRKVRLIVGIKDSNS